MFPLTSLWKCSDKGVYENTDFWKKWQWFCYLIVWLQSGISILEQTVRKLPVPYSSWIFAIT